MVSTRMAHMGVSAAGQEEDRSYHSLPENKQLNFLCSNAFAPRGNSAGDRIAADESWEPVREWLRSHPGEIVREAATTRGDNGMTALHFACRNAPPTDVIDVFLSIAAETAAWSDTFGWLPIHYSCATGAGVEVIKKLAEAYPQSKTTVDRRGRTPLHFALGNGGNGENSDQIISPTVIAILSSTGAASYADDNGMLPLHYACAYGASEETLLVLTNAHPEGIMALDVRSRTPLLFALSNAGRDAAPCAVRHLLRLNENLVNSIRGGPLPLRVLAEFAHTLKQTSQHKPQRLNAQTCLEHLIDAKPDPTADFFTALQGLPDWLSEEAVVLPHVQGLLNEKIAQRFPTAVLILDFYFLAMVIVAYSINVIEAINNRFNPDKNDGVDILQLIPLYIGVGYFFVREILQTVSLLALKSFYIDPSKVLNIAYIILVTYLTCLMLTGSGDKYRFRTVAAITVLILWTKVLAYLRNMLIDFAVFVGGVFYVVRRLAAFLMCLGIILIAFAQMFLTVYQQSDTCFVILDRPIEDVQCEEAQSFAYCSYWSSFLSVYTMLLGEVDETIFADDLFATLLFVLFMFLVVILLASVLIAIVTDSYKVIQDQRAAIVFWTNRLDFVAEMDAIANGPWKKRLRRSMGLAKDSGGDKGAGFRQSKAKFGSKPWTQLMELFEDEDDFSILSVEFWAYLVLRVVTGLIIIPLWLVLGVLSAGWLWPPQVREAIFTSKLSKHSSEGEKEDALRKTQVTELHREVRILREELEQEMVVDRAELVQMKSSFTERRVDISNEMKHIKRVMTMLFEQQSTFV